MKVWVRRFAWWAVAASVVVWVVVFAATRPSNPTPPPAPHDPRVVLPTPSATALPTVGATGRLPPIGAARGAELGTAPASGP